MKTIILIGTIILVGCVGLQAADYQSIVDLYPVQAQAAQIVQIGGTIEIEGCAYRVVAECKSVNEESWMQFIDTDIAGAGELDNEPDFAIHVCGTVKTN